MDTKKYTKNYFEVINERFSCRSFTAEKLSTEQIQIILESAQLAPTACNFQPQIIYVVENPVLLDKLKEAYTEYAELVLSKTEVAKLKEKINKKFMHE